MKVILLRPAIKALRRISDQEAERIEAALERLEAGAPNLDLRRVVGTSHFRLRVGDLRILLELGEDEARVVDIVRRGAAYR